MATLIGRECWHVGATLSRGKIVEHLTHIPAVVILRGLGAGGRLTVHASQALLTIDAALREAEEAADYWARKVRELEAERDASTD
jgi:hypothetical protein